MNNKKLATKITSKIMRMEGAKKEGYRLAIMFRKKDGEEITVGGRNKQSLILVIEEILNKFNNFK